ncbi:MAG: glycosyltransferase family 2 protein [Chloroflexi bacterium]|nr:glycosyltransferase family 2 protein [Chloroflexota bacterium]
MKQPSISVFFPAYNDAGTIPSMVIAAILTLRELTDDYEVIVVNDASQDHTGEMLAELERQYDCVRIITHASNRGYGGALRSGFAHSTKELIFYTDGDAQYDPRELKLLLGVLTPDVDMVNGYKITRHDPLHRIIIGTIYQHFVRLMFGLKLYDPDCDFRVMRRSIFNKVHLTSDSGVICVEMMKKIGDHNFRIAETPVHHYHRAYGKSQFFNFRRLLRVAVDLSKLWVKLVLKKEHLKESLQPELALQPGQPANERS